MIVRADGKNFIFREFPAWWVEMIEDADTRKIITNAKFDLMWMMDATMRDEGSALLTAPRNIHDPMLKSQLAHEYRTRSGAQKAGRAELWRGNDLKSMLGEYLGVTIGKTIDHDQTDWTGPWSREMEEYMLEDIAYLQPLDAHLDRILSDQGQERAAAIEMDVVPGTAWMTLNGITPDVAGWHEAIQDWRDHNNHLIWHLRKLFPGVENFNSVPQLMKAMPEALGAPLQNTRKATLKQLAPEFEAIDILLEQRHYQTRLKNWGPHYLREYVCARCGRFHPEWRQIGTETSRFSCSKPNLQQIPREQEFRNLFVAAPGCLLASLDYSAIEVVTAAVRSNCAALLQACATGDPHKAAVALMTGKAFDQITKAERQDGKIANFGLLFGGGADGYVQQARDLFGVSKSRGQAEIEIRNYFQAFPELRVRKNWAYDLMKNGPERLEVVNAVGYRRVLEGFNRKPTSILNTDIQSSAGYGLKSSFRLLREADLLPFLCMQVHDELVFEFPEDLAEELADQARACMIAGMREVLGARVPVNVEGSIGRVWLK